jgi:4-diphosphocytidyl-2-C-methyl-D-erythritol kinase
LPGTLRISAFAKINLHLGVLGQRPDGYHELRTIFQTIDLHDTLEVRRVRRPGIDLSISGARLDPGPDNLVCRALDALSGELRIAGGWRVRLEKRIPAAAGLGGGSSDAAAALTAGMRLARARIAASRLAEIAAGLGADVPFFLVGGRALGVGRGDEIYPLADGAASAVLIVQPKNTFIATRDAYGWLDGKLTKAASAHKLWVSCARCWDSGEAEIVNEFEAAVFSRFPRLRQVKRRLLQAGAAGAALAGSGSAVFGLFRNPAQARRTARQFPDDQVFVTRTLTRTEFRRRIAGERL